MDQSIVTPRVIFSLIGNNRMMFPWDNLGSQKQFKFFGLKIYTYVETHDGTLTLYPLDIER